MNKFQDKYKIRKVGLLPDWRHLRSVKEILNDLSCSYVTFAERALLYYLYHEGVLKLTDSQAREISSLMFSGLLSKQEGGELAGPLNPKWTLKKEAEALTNWIENNDQS